MRRGREVLALALTTALPMAAFAGLETFETFTPGQSVNGQGGWTVEDSFGNSGELFDEQVQDDGTGNQVWQLSNAFVATSYSNQPFSQSAPQIAGETGAKLFNDYGSVHSSPNNPPLSSGTAASDSFTAKWDFKSATGSGQNLFLAISASAKQSPLRMSYLSISDSVAGGGFDLGFFDTGVGGAFQGTTLATGLNYSDWHTVEMSIQFNDGLAGDGSGNDIVNIFVNGNAVHSGSTWESYFANVADGGIPVTEKRAVDSVIFRQSSGAVASNAGNGLFIDNVEISNTFTPIPEPATLGLAGIGGLILMSRRTAKWALGAEDEASVSAA